MCVVDQVGPDNTVEQQQQQLRKCFGSFKRPEPKFTDDEVFLIFGAACTVVVVVSVVLWITCCA